MADNSNAAESLLPQPPALHLDADAQQRSPLRFAQTPVSGGSDLQGLFRIAPPNDNSCQANYCD
jgi:hypothetical protein